MYMGHCIQFCWWKMVFSVWKWPPQTHGARLGKRPFRTIWHQQLCVRMHHKYTTLWIENWTLHNLTIDQQKLSCICFVKSVFTSLHHCDLNFGHCSQLYWSIIVFHMGKEVLQLVKRRTPPGNHCPSVRSCWCPKYTHRPRIRPFGCQTVAHQQNN